MDTIQADQAKSAADEPTIEEIGSWDENKLLGWIQQKLSIPLKHEDRAKFLNAVIDGSVFLRGADDKKFFQDAGLSFGASVKLAELARETRDNEQAGDTGCKLSNRTDRQRKDDRHIRGSTTRKRERPPHTHIPPPPKRTRVDGSSLAMQGKPQKFQSGHASFHTILMENNQAYFDRTGYISTLENLGKIILFCRPRRFGKSLTISMLEHFHGLQYTNEHQTFYQGLDVQKNIEEKKCKPGQYFVLKFDFSTIQASPDLAEANRRLIVALNYSIENFYKTYATYLNDDVTSLYGNIDRESPGISLQKCNWLVQDALSLAREEYNEKLDDIQGIYLLVDEYDAFTNNYLESPSIAEPYKSTWDSTAVGSTFRSFWSTVKLLCSQEIQRVFITGILPLSLSGVGSGFNVARNLSFHPHLAGLCGLTSSDLEKVLEKICKDDENDKHLLEMTKFFNGYHFCNTKRVETVYNTETCLAYLQSIVDGGYKETEDPPNSEVAEQFLEKFATSASVIADFEKALEYDKNGNFVPLEYDRLKFQFTLRDLSESGSESSWRSLMIYFGALTFRPEDPANHLKIPNKVAVSRIARVVLERYKLSKSLVVALQRLTQDGDIERALSCYRNLMTQRDVTVDDLTRINEEKHRDSFYFSLLRNHQLLPHAEFKVTKSDKTNGRIDLLISGFGQLTVTEWKFLRINFLDVQGSGNTKPDMLTKAVTLSNYDLSKILQIKFSKNDQFHQGTIQEWVMENAAGQLRNYIKSDEVTQQVKDGGLKLRAHLIIIVGSRHILLWDMDKEGNLAYEPRLVGMTST